MRAQEATRIAVRYLPRVERMARGMARRLPAHIAVDDLTQAGAVGMLAGLRRFDPARSKSLDAYLARRVRGAILDELRALDPLSREQRRHARALRDAGSALVRELRRTPTEEEVAARAGVTLGRARAVRAAAQAMWPLSLDGSGVDLPDTRAVDPCDVVSLEELRARLVRAIATLPERLQTVLALYYVDGLSLKEIGELLGVTESRACQLSRGAARRLKAALADG